MNTKQCTRCGETKPLNEFYKKKNTKDGYGYWCKLCHKEYQQENQEKIREREKQYCLKNKDKIRKRKRKYQHEHREEIKAYMRIYRAGIPDTADRNSYLKRTYDITLREYDLMLELQGGTCAICGKTPEENGRRLSVDHNHETGKVRGLLCGMCNRALGFLNDDPEMCELAKVYLQKHRK